MATAEDACNAEGARQTPPDGVDLISGLDDDVLLRILVLVGDASDAVSTGALSRRWLRLWTRVPALRFVSRPVPRSATGAERCAAMDRYASFVNNILARRTTHHSDCAVESLDILYKTTDSEYERSRDYRDMPEYDMDQMLPASVKAAQGWIRYAFQNRVKCFALDLCLPDPPTLLQLLGVYDFDYDEDHGSNKEGDGEKKPVVLLDELPSPVRLETMRLALGGRTRLRLPAAMKFASLTDLSLEKIKFVDGGARLLARLVSSVSCPLLQKLRMTKLGFPNFSEEMLLEADVLSELWVEDVNVVTLELRTPRLRVLLMDKCHHEVLRISAPMLEELALFYKLGCSPRQIEVDGDLPCVRILKLHMWSHRTHEHHYGEANNDVNTLILKHCSSVTCLEVTLDGRKVFEDDVDIIKSRVPHLPHITTLTVNVSFSCERHDFGAGVASLFTRFSNLRHLSLHLPFFLTMNYDLRAGLGLLCNHQDHWISNEISMDHLQEVELNGLTGVDCELWFMKAVLASARGLRKVAISFNPKCWQHEYKMDAFERMLLDEGMLVSHRDTHVLTFGRA